MEINSGGILQRGFQLKERGNFWLRSLDRYIGIALILFLSIFRRRRKRPNSIKSVLVVKLGTIGDTLLLAPVLKAVKDAGAELTVVGTKNNIAVLKGYKFIDTLEIFEISKTARSMSYLPVFLRSLNKRRYDLVLDFEPWTRISALLAFFVKTGLRAGFRTKGQAKHFAFDLCVDHNNAVHEAVNYGSLARSAGITAKLHAVPFPVGALDKEFVREYLCKKGLASESLVLFHPWSSGYRGRFKEWASTNFSALATLLINEGYMVGITGTKENAPDAAAITARDPERIFSFCGELTLAQAAALIQMCPLLIAVNTGIMHLGAAVGATVISLNGPAGVLRWGPADSTGAGFDFESSWECAPCLNLGSEYACEEGGCMDDIKIDAVFKKAMEMMGKECKTGVADA